jgi:hypothetical protein
MMGVQNKRKSEIIKYGFDIEFLNRYWSGGIKVYQGFGLCQYLLLRNEVLSRFPKCFCGFVQISFHLHWTIIMPQSEAVCFEKLGFSKL